MDMWWYRVGCEIPYGDLSVKHTRTVNGIDEEVNQFLAPNPLYPELSPCQTLLLWDKTLLFSFSLFFLPHLHVTVVTFHLVSLWITHLISEFQSAWKFYTHDCFLGRSFPKAWLSQWIDMLQNKIKQNIILGWSHLMFSLFVVVLAEARLVV